MKLVAVNHSSGAEYLTWEHFEYEVTETIDEAIQQVIKGEADAIVANLPVLGYMNRVFHKNTLIISDHVLHRNNMGFALPSDSPLRENINHYLLMELTEPKWQDELYQFLSKKP